MFVIIVFCGLFAGGMFFAIAYAAGAAETKAEREGNIFAYWLFWVGLLLLFTIAYINTL